MPYAYHEYFIEAYPGKYFKQSSMDSWTFTENPAEADSFFTEKEAKEHANALDLAILYTYWDYTDIPPKPNVVHLPKNRRYVEYDNKE